MEKVAVDLGKDSYVIEIAWHSLSKLKDYLKSHQEAIVITDQNVDKLYGQDLPGHKYVMAPGESHKTMETVSRMVDHMLSLRLTRQAKVIALGGGIVGDVAGFCASIYLRGIEYLQVPTTLLSQVDSSVGGKTGVNTTQVKNGMGSFYQPQKVIIDPAVLQTLPKRELINGMGEVIKHGIIGDYQLLQFIKNNYAQILALQSDAIVKVIKANCQIKAKVVSADETEKGLRKILNFGHTIGHSLETITGYRAYSHGEAVIIGMLYEARLARDLGMIDDNYLTEIVELLELTNISFNISAYQPQKLISLMTSDKKNKSNKISFMLPTKPAEIQEVLLSADEVGALWKGLIR